MIQHAFDYVAANSWESRRSEYLALVDALCAKGRRNARQTHQSAV